MVKMQDTVANEMMKEISSAEKIYEDEGSRQILYDGRFGARGSQAK